MYFEGSFSTHWQYAVPVICILTIVGAAASIWRQYQRLSHIKGPLLASCSPLWLFYHTCKGDVYLACEENLKRYGSPLRLAPNVITIDDPQSYRIMTAPKSVWTRGDWFKGVKFDLRVDNILSMTNEKQHAEMRLKLTPGYSGNDVPTLEQDIDGRIVELKELIAGNFISKGNSFDFAHVAHLFTLDVLTQIGFGKALGFLTKNEDIFCLIQNTKQALPVLELACHHPTIRRLLHHPLLASLQPKATDKTGLGAVLGHAQQTVNDRLDGTDTYKDMLGSFMKHGLSRVEMQSESVLLMIAGADSTATALRNTILYTISNPIVYSRLIKEIDETVAAGKASTPVITLAEAQDLPYLRAVVMEGLRMFMPLVGLAGRQSPKGGATLNGVYIPEGTQVGLSTYAMLRREALFGHDADTFRPERWLDGDPDFIQSMEKNHSLIFGSGRTSCLGKNIAMMELRKAVFEIFRSYDMVRVNPLDSITIRVNGAAVQKNMFVRAYHREADVAP
ncbi:hypothetical protein AMS68_004323 [Peltaster fructicola]|uniref:Cytochrome P450 n=1 Tax=Peltaster fructicola TaxID=286661 RepID=A0A6H0XVU3_9PEZI|nr:hypothetical protein AMS68_004323 [Peltaster fructicola]